jgi:hypothetical protein
MSPRLNGGGNVADVIYIDKCDKFRMSPRLNGGGNVADVIYIEKYRSIMVKNLDYGQESGREFDASA